MLSLLNSQTEFKKKKIKTFLSHLAERKEILTEENLKGKSTDRYFSNSLFILKLIRFHICRFRGANNVIDLPCYFWRKIRLLVLKNCKCYYLQFIV